jgi:molybdopterin converting factor small subunit
LSELAGGKRELELDGSTVGEVLQALEREHPDVRGWILDERGLIREHINVFVNKEYGQEDTSVTSADRLHVIPAISGG